MEFAGELLHKSALESSAPAPPSRLHKSPAVDAWPQGQTSTPDPEIVREKFARKCYSWMRIIIIQESVKSKTFCKASDEEIEHEGRCGGIKFARARSVTGSMVTHCFLITGSSITSSFPGTESVRGTDRCLSSS